MRFADSVREVVREHGPVFVEVSPHPLLGRAVEDVQLDAGFVPTVVTTLVRQQSEARATARALGRAYALGAPVDWHRRYGDEGPRVPLPSYAWDTEEYRTDESQTAEATEAERCS